MKMQFAQYGNTILKRGICPHCKRPAFVLGNEYQCCGRRAYGLASVVAMMSTADQRRAFPPKVVRDRAIKRQHNHCIYCGTTFGGVVVRGDDIIIVRLEWDHLVPYSYSQNNQTSNFVAACHICNHIKRNLMFETLSDARIYIQGVRTEKGYERVSEKNADWYELAAEG